MEELFGPISATTIAAIVSVVVQLVKSQWQLEGKVALALSFLISMVFFLPFYLIWFWDTLPFARLLYSSVFYSISGFLLACGFYSAVKTSLGK